VRPKVEPKQAPELFFVGELQDNRGNWTAPIDLPSLDGISELPFDTETNGLKWRDGDRPIGLSFMLPNGKTFYLPWGHRGGGNLDEEAIRRWAQRELRDKLLVGANIKFDVHMMRAWGVDLEDQGCRVTDIQHYAALLDDHRRKFSLDVLAKEFLGEEKVGKELDAKRMADYHAGTVAQRAEADVRQTWLIRQAMWPLLDAQELQKVRQLEDDVIFPTCEMERNAAPLDRPLLKAWVRKSLDEYNALLMDISKEVGFQVNPDKNADWQRLFEKLKIPIIHFTEAGRPSFTEEVLKVIDNPIVQKVRRAGKIASLKSKFLDAYDAAATEDNLLQFSLHQLRSDEHGTVRGRYSSSDKNIQQVMNPENQIKAFGSDDYLIRRLFIPGPQLPGYDTPAMFLSADAMQIEYRVMAHFAGAQKILAAYADDPYTDFHELVLGLVKPYKPDMTRKAAKNLNFAKIYGAGRDRIAASLGISRAESDKFVDTYDRLFPEVGALLKKAAALAEQRGYVKTISGRRARFTEKRFMHGALNAVIQGTAADVNKKKIVELHRERFWTGLKMRMTVHDEVCGDIPDHDAAVRVREILNQQSYPELRVPILWDVKMGPNWADCVKI
jgi:DNA polymerase-1